MSDIDSKVDVMDAFKEKRWGKDEDGEHIAYPVISKLPMSYSLVRI